MLLWNSPLDHTVVALASGLNFVLGAAFYGPVVGKYWLRAMTLDKGTPNWMRQANMGQALILEFVFGYLKVVGGANSRCTL